MLAAGIRERAEDGVLQCFQRAGWLMGINGRGNYQSIGVHDRFEDGLTVVNINNAASGTGVTAFCARELMAAVRDDIRLFSERLSVSGNHH